MNKFSARRTGYNGCSYASKAEARHAATLDVLLRGGAIKGWTRQVPIPLSVNGRPVCRYVVDFRVEHLDGRIEWVEVKGHETPEFKLKRKLFEAAYLQDHPGETYSVIRA